MHKVLIPLHNIHLRAVLQQVELQEYEYVSSSVSSMWSCAFWWSGFLTVKYFISPVGKYVGQCQRYMYKEFRRGQKQLSRLVYEVLALARVRGTSTRSSEEVKNSLVNWFMKYWHSLAIAAIKDMCVNGQELVKCARATNTYKTSIVEKPIPHTSE